MLFIVYLYYVVNYYGNKLYQNYIKNMKQISSLVSSLSFRVSAEFYIIEIDPVFSEKISRQFPHGPRAEK